MSYQAQYTNSKSDAYTEDAKILESSITSNDGDPNRSDKDQGSPANNDKHGGEQEICRNFLNGICFRGTQCKFVHPEEKGGDPSGRERIVVCRDYLNKGCRRDHCRLVHCTVADADEYKRNGFVSESLARAYIAVSNQRSVADRPLCKEFAMGRCNRGYECRFWHIDAERERRQRLNDLRRSPGGAQAPDAPGREAGPDDFARNQQQDYAGRFEGRMSDNKRPRYGDSGYGSDFVAAGGPITYPILSQVMTMPVEDPQIVSLTEQNPALRRRIEALKQTMSDMQAANEALLGENKRLRAKTTDMASMSASTAYKTAMFNVPRLNGGQGGVSGSIVSLAAGQAPAVHPSMAAAYSASSDGLRWSYSRM